MPLLHFLRLLIGQHVLAYRGYIATAWFGVHLTSPDNLHMQLDVDEINFKILLLSTVKEAPPQIAFYKTIPTYVWTRPESRCESLGISSVSFASLRVVSAFSVPQRDPVSPPQCLGANVLFSL